MKDGWTWTLDSKGAFTVNKLTPLLDSQTLGPFILSNKTIWNSWISMKVNVFICRALNDRLPTLCNLDNHGLDSH